MRKIMGALAIAAMCFALLGCNEGGSPNIAVVDMNRLMRDSAPGKAGLKFIETQQTGLQAKLDAIQDRLEKNPQDESAMRELQQVYASSQQRIQAEGQNVVTMLFDAIQRVLNDYRKTNGYAMLIRAEALDSYDPALDVTNAVMAEVDKLKLDFKPVELPEPKEEATQAGDNAPAEAAPESEAGAADTQKK